MPALVFCLVARNSVKDRVKDVMEYGLRMLKTPPILMIGGTCHANVAGSGVYHGMTVAGAPSIRYIHNSEIHPPMYSSSGNGEQCIQDKCLERTKAQLTVCPTAYSTYATHKTFRCSLSSCSPTLYFILRSIFASYYSSYWFCVTQPVILRR